jgi:hypothetical protein
MKVYATPKDITPPAFEDAMVDGKYSMEKDDELTQRYFEELRAWLKRNNCTHRKAGLIVRFPVADGCAQYMIMNATSMIWLPLGDAWQIPDAHARGLRISELQGSKS